MSEEFQPGDIPDSVTHLTFGHGFKITISVSYSLDGGKTFQTLDFYDCNAFICDAAVHDRGFSFLITGFDGTKYCTLAKIAPYEFEMSNTISGTGKNLLTGLQYHKDQFVPFFCQQFPRIHPNLIVIRSIWASFQG